MNIEEKRSKAWNHFCEQDSVHDDRVRQLSKSHKSLDDIKNELSEIIEFRTALYQELVNNIHLFNPPIKDVIWYLKRSAKLDTIIETFVNREFPLPCPEMESAWSLAIIEFNKKVSQFVEKSEGLEKEKKQLEFQVKKIKSEKQHFQTEIKSLMREREAEERLLAEIELLRQQRKTEKSLLAEIEMLKLQKEEILSRAKDISSVPDYFGLAKKKWEEMPNVVDTTRDIKQPNIHLQKEAFNKINSILKYPLKKRYSHANQTAYDYRGRFQHVFSDSEKIRQIAEDAENAPDFNFAIEGEDSFIITLGEPVVFFKHNVLTSPGTCPILLTANLADSLREGKSHDAGPGPLGKQYLKILSEQR